jgi:hypothetical protein
MIWLTWRQFRAHVWIAAGTLAVVGTVLAITGSSLANGVSTSGIGRCRADCGILITNFLGGRADGTVYYLGIGLLYLVPALIGMFWGAPLTARELETGTYRLVWNQSVTRTRWLATKLVAVGGASMATAGLLSVALSWWARPIDDVALNRVTPILFGTRGIVPVGYAAFAFALGVTLGVLIRRTVAAMATTLAGYAAAAVAMPLWLRTHLVPAVHVRRPLDVSSLTGTNTYGDGSMTIFGGDTEQGAWVVSNLTLTPSGEVFTGPTNPQYCGDTGSNADCAAWLDTLRLQQDLVYHPASHFWALQWAETGVFLAAAVLLTGFCFWWTRRRLG